MKDPYNTLGVSSSADDEDIKNAYKKLARKHYDSHSSFSREKMEKLDAAYDDLMSRRRSAGNSKPVSEFSDVRRLIENSRLSDAEEILDSVRSLSRGCEWNYLKALILFKRGFTGESLLYAERALEKDPFCAECAELRKAIEGSSGKDEEHGSLFAAFKKLIPGKKHRR